MKKRVVYLFALFLLLFFVIGSSGSSLNTPPSEPNQPQPAPSPLNIYALDIGQGDSLLIVSPTGKTVLIDTGNPGNEQHVLNALLNDAGSKKIDLFIASHPHADHIGSAPEVIKDSTVARVLDSGFPHSTTTYERFLEAIKDSGAQFILAVPGQTFDLGGGAVISVKANLQAKVLKVGHHGSRYATSDAFLRAVRPEAAVISVGAGNNYGHPTQEALDRLKNAGVKVYRTDLQGEIKITSDGSAYQVDTQKVAPLTALFMGRVSQDDSRSPSAAPMPSNTAAPARPAPLSEAAVSGSIIGNKNSKKYHQPNCPGYNQTLEKNRVYFKSAEEAEAAWFTRAGNCPK